MFIDSFPPLDTEDLSPKELCELAYSPDLSIDDAFQVKSIAIAQLLAAISLNRDNEAAQYTEANHTIAGILWERRFELVRQLKTD